MISYWFEGKAEEKIVKANSCLVYFIHFLNIFFCRIRKENVRPQRIVCGADIRIPQHRKVKLNKTGKH